MPFFRIPVSPRFPEARVSPKQGVGFPEARVCPFALFAQRLWPAFSTIVFDQCVRPLFRANVCGQVSRLALSGSIFGHYLGAVFAASVFGHPLRRRFSIGVFGHCSRLVFAGRFLRLACPGSVADRRFRPVFVGQYCWAVVRGSFGGQSLRRRFATSVFS